MFIPAPPKVRLSDPCQSLVADQRGSPRTSGVCVLACPTGQGFRLLSRPTPSCKPLHVRPHKGICPGRLRLNNIQEQGQDPAKCSHPLQTDRGADNSTWFPRQCRFLGAAARWIPHWTLGTGLHVKVVYGTLDVQYGGGFPHYHLWRASRTCHRVLEGILQDPLCQ